MPKVSEEQITFCGKFTFAFQDTLQIVLFLINIFLEAISEKQSEISIDLQAAIYDVNINQIKYTI
jgi:hypothetical protein